MKKIILIAGPSGAGKTTISNYLEREYGIPRVITHTTRPKREGEVDKESYFFETDESFNKLHFFEHIKYGNYQYGSSKEALETMWKKYDIVSLIVDIQGVKSYLSKLDPKQVYFLYVTTSTMDELRERLINRGDSKEIVKKRLSGSELNRLPEDLKQTAHILLNDKWNKTESDLNTIVTKLKQN